MHINVRGIRQLVEICNVLDCHVLFITRFLWLLKVRILMKGQRMVTARKLNCFCTLTSMK